MPYGLLGLLFLIPALLMGQQKGLEGSLKTREGAAVPFATVSIRNAQGHIIAYGTSNNKGSFSIGLPDGADRRLLTLDIRYLGYKPVSLALYPPKPFYTVVMEQQPIDLDEVKVKSRPRIDRRGDTLSYEVGAFAKREDRSIGDVIKRLPGMEVSESGEIRFNGKKISHFYIDGDDLLNERYAIGTKTIPHAMVKGLEVLQNHQPVRVLKNKVLSDEVSINLLIRDDAKLKASGQAKLGAGLPRQYDDELNALIFNKKHKMLDVLKGNNTGEDLAHGATGEGLLSSGTAGEPGLPKNRYYNNHSGAVNVNELFNLSTGLQLKATINLFLDRNQLQYGSDQALYLKADTIRYSERQEMEARPFFSEIVLSAEDNKDHQYVSEQLKVSYAGNNYFSSLMTNDQGINQQLRNRVQRFSNQLEYIPQLKNKNLVRIQWKLGYDSQPQRLTIVPGVNAAVLNDSVPYAATRQTAGIPSWRNDWSAGYGLMNGTVKQRYRLGLASDIQTLRSALRLEQLDAGISPFAGSGDNDLHWSQHRLYGEAAYDYGKGRLLASLTLPWSWQTLRYRDNGFGLDNNKQWLLFNPVLLLKYKIYTEDEFSLNYAFNKDIGTIEDLYRGVVLGNYRTLLSNNAGLQEKNSHDAGIRYTFQRSIRLLFINAGLNWSKASANTITSSVVNNRISQTVLLPLRNDVSTLAANAGISKYLFFLGATASLKTSWNSTRYNQLLNNELLPYRNNSLHLNPGLETRLWDRVSFLYDASLSWNNSRLVTGAGASVLPEQHVRFVDQSLKLTVTFWKEVFLSASGRQQQTIQEQRLRYFFADVNARRRIAKWRSDIELNLTNLANVKVYETYRISANSFWYSQYALRGRMAVVKYTFNF